MNNPPATDRPTTGVPASGIPGTIDAIDDAWLTATFRTEGLLPDGSTVRIVDRSPVGDGSNWICDVARLRLEVDGDPGSVPASLVAKVPVEDEVVRSMLGPVCLYEREGLFFQHAAPFLGDAVPRVWLVAENTGADEHLLLIEDLVDGRFGDQLAGCTADEAEMALRTLARLHGRFWESSELASFDWLRPIGFPDSSLGAQLYTGSLAAFRKSFGHLLDPANEVVVATLADHSGAILERLLAGPNTVTHFDYRLDNLFFTNGPDPEVRMIDFQTSCRSGPGYDVGLFLSQSIDTDVRRAHEDRLLGAYLDELRACGVDDYTADDLHLAYRYGVLYGWLTPVFVTSNLDMSNQRALDMWTAVIGRSQAAMADLRVAELLG